MSYTIDDMLEIPYSIGPYTRVVKNGVARLVKWYGKYVYLDGATSFGIGWNSANSTFQVQWRWMRRLIPTDAILVDPSGGDVWYGWNGADLSSGTQGTRDEWGDWQGQDLSVESATPTASWSDGSSTVYGYASGTSAVEIAMPYDVSTYDLARLQVRVRVFQTGGTVSEWGERETVITYTPVVNSVDALLNADGTLTITADTNLARGGNLISADGFVVDGVLMPGSAFSASGGADPSATVSTWPVGAASVTIAGLAIATADGAYLRMDSVTAAVTDPTPSVPLPEPSIGIDDNGVITVGADPSTIADLTGTTWYIDEAPVCEGSEGSNALLFTSGEGSYAQLVRAYTGTGGSSTLMYVDGGDYFRVYSELGGGWLSPDYRTVSITGGADAADPDLVAWFKSNAVLVDELGYDTVTVRASYVDEEGNVYDELVDMAEDGDVWRGTIPTPPLDVPVTVTVVYTVGDDWDYATKDVIVPSDGRILLDWGDSHFALKYNVTRAYSNDLIGDVVSIAGKDLPVSRYSTSRTVKMTVTGRVINPDKLPAIGDMWLGELNVLNEPHDWILRLPGGMRRRIAIETWVPQFDDSTCDTMTNVTITANEVSA